ncbi:MAG: PTS fructose transporter subunit IIA [Candidatus Puniceispirillum sp.]|nr:PTS fructose transporter subunit IIA [Candidatus Puniceispirillum sp.]MCA0369954.1 PTS sugar transporter subunit IIA [Pseudomonadota bacterium]
MIGLVIVTHGQLAQEFLQVLEHVVGPQSATACLCVNPEDDMEERRLTLETLIKDVNRGSGVLLFTDMFGGTPSNLAISLLGRHEALEVIAGVNVPMLVKFAKVRASLALAQAAEEAQEAGKKYINVASSLLGAA